MDGAPLPSADRNQAGDTSTAIDAAFSGLESPGIRFDRLFGHYGKLYERQLVRIQERELVSAVLAERSRKYGNSLGALQELVAAGDFWLFELRPRGQL